MDTPGRFIFILFLFVSSIGFSQVHSSGSYEYLITTSQQDKHIQELTSNRATGRATGTPGAQFAREYITEAFRNYGLRSWRGHYQQEFQVYHGKTMKPGIPPLTGYNVVGYVPSSRGGSDYVIVGAHYDHMGMLDGKFFPGADDNASGVTVLLELAKAFGEMGKKELLEKNLVFVAFDANNLNNAGSKYFVSDLRIAPERITCMINLDQIGSNLAPPGINPAYLLILGAEKLGEWEREQLTICNSLSTNPLHLDFTYYGSEPFYKIFYRLSDQQSFTEQGIPALLFTSGITVHTNKESDLLSNLSLPVLDQRTKLLYKFIYQLVRR